MPHRPTTKANQRSTKPSAGEYPRIEVRSVAQLRAWLDENHQTSHGVWVITFKKLRPEWYVSAVSVCEEALCFGWIDSLPRSLDAERTMLLITPRKEQSKWSRVNKARVAALTAAGRMTQAGFHAVAHAQRSGTWTALDSVENLDVPADLAAQFERVAAAARRNFDEFPRSAKRGILEWIQAAKRPETRAQRIEETVALAARNERANQWRRK